MQHRRWREQHLGDVPRADADRGRRASHFALVLHASLYGRDRRGHRQRQRQSAGYLPGADWNLPVSAVAYVRVSSRSQDLATQRTSIERAAAARGDVVGTWYAEKRSARTLERAELARLRADARAGLVRRL